MSDQVGNHGADHAVEHGTDHVPGSMDIRAQEKVFASFLRFVTWGIGISFLSVLFVVFLFIRRLMVGPEAEGVFTLFGIAFFLIGLTLFGVGLLGEYIGRIYQQVRHRPRYLIGAILESSEEGGVKSEE